jgi:hypothetical protein
MMADPFQLIASALTVAKFAKKTIKLIESAENVDRHVLDMRQWIRDLRRNVKMVKRLVEHRQDLKNNGMVSRDEQTIWRHLESSFDTSGELLQEFESALERVYRSKPGRITKIIMELRLQWNREEIGNFERRLDAQVQAIQLWILPLQV